MTDRKILVIGSVNVDHVLNVEELPRAGETSAGSNYRVVAGGKGANQAVACARLGGDTQFLACVGDDPEGHEAIAALSGDGMDTSAVKVSPGCRTGVALIFVNDQGENCIGISAEANTQLTTEMVRSNQQAISSADYLLMQLEVPLDSITLAAEIARDACTQVILNPAPATKLLPDQLLRCIDIITPNQTEAEILTGVRVNSEGDAARAAELLHLHGIGIVIITMGRSGAYVSDQSGKHMMSGYRVTAVDTTAAGDTFNGALVAALAEGRELEEAVNFANAAAAMSVTKGGAQASIPLRKELTQWLLDHTATKA
ncbi:MAG: ribokinase [Proteobacteria bacterium]|nr:ribokinase [Pseudomonadota bacterium]